MVPRRPVVGPIGAPGVAVAVPWTPVSGNHDDVSWRSQVDGLVGHLRGELAELPYDPTPERLYRAADLYAGIEHGFAATIDQAIYRRAQIAERPTLHPVEELTQRLHDHGISLALSAFRAGRRLVGVMGGHAMERGTGTYRSVVDLGRALTVEGFCVTTGGGPGAMEAANLGAATVALDRASVDTMVDRLSASPSFDADPDGFAAAALDVAASIVDRVGSLTTSLSVPTWFYGHEPSNPFASHIAKYFSNSEREAGLLAIATAGIVYVPGGPGTMQEVFQDAAQNAYVTFGGPSPMVFLDPPEQQGWWADSGVLAALDRVFVDQDGNDRPGRNLIVMAGDVTEAVAALS